MQCIQDIFMQCIQKFFYVACLEVFYVVYLGIFYVAYLGIFYVVCLEIFYVVYLGIFYVVYLGIFLCSVFMNFLCSVFRNFFFQYEVFGNHPHGILIKLCIQNSHSNVNSYLEQFFNLYLGCVSRSNYATISINKPSYLLGQPTLIKVKSSFAYRHVLCSMS